MMPSKTSHEDKLSSLKMTEPGILSLHVLEGILAVILKSLKMESSLSSA